MRAARFWVRAGLTVLAVGQGGAGLVQLVAPRLFYDNAPVPGHPWVSALPPYNEHLVRDLGAMGLGFVVVLVVAAVTLERTLVRTAAAANLVLAVPHLVFHLSHREVLPPADALAQTAALAVGVAIPVLLLVAVGRVLPAPEPPGSG